MLRRISPAKYVCAVLPPRRGKKRRSKMSREKLSFCREAARCCLQVETNISYLHTTVVSDGLWNCCSCSRRRQWGWIQKIVLGGAHWTWRRQRSETRRKAPRRRGLGRGLPDPFSTVQVWQTDGQTDRQNDKILVAYCKASRVKKSIY